MVGMGMSFRPPMQCVSMLADAEAIIPHISVVIGYHSLNTRRREITGGG